MAEAQLGATPSGATDAATKGYVDVTAGSATPTASSLARWDTNSNLNAANLVLSNVGNMNTATSGTGTAGQLAKLSIPANFLAVGMNFKFKVYGAQSAAATVTFNLRFGTADTTADTAVFTLAPVYTAAGVGYFEGLITVRTIGSGAGSFVGNAFSLPALGGSTITPAVSGNTTALSTTLNTTLSSTLSLWVSTSAGTFTAQNALLTLGAA